MKHRKTYLAFFLAFLFLFSGGVTVRTFSAGTDYPLQVTSTFNTTSGFCPDGSSYCTNGYYVNVRNNSTSTINNSAFSTRIPSDATIVNQTWDVVDANYADVTANGALLDKYGHVYASSDALFTTDSGLVKTTQSTLSNYMSSSSSSSSLVYTINENGELVYKKIGDCSIANYGYGGVVKGRTCVMTTDASGTTLKNVKQVYMSSSSNRYGIAITTTGDVYTFGSNANLNLGYSTDKTLQMNYAQKVKTAASTYLTNADHLSGNGTHVITKTGEVYSWGVNPGTYNLNYFGNGQQTDQPYATAVLTAAGKTLSGVSDVISNSDSNYALTTGGYAYSWGGYGIMGGDPMLAQGSSVNTSPYAAPVLSASGTALSKISKIVSETGLQAYALTTDGLLYSWGDATTNGALGNGTTTKSFYAQPVKTSSSVNLSSVTDISMSGNPTYGNAIALVGGKVYSWGYGGNGANGNGSTSNNLYAAPVVGTDSKAITGITSIREKSKGGFAITSAGKVYSWGATLVSFFGGSINGNNSTASNLYADFVQLADGSQLTGVSKIVTDPFSSSGAYALTTAGAIYRWGPDMSLTNYAQPLQNTQALASVATSIPFTFTKTTTEANGYKKYDYTIPEINPGQELKFFMNVQYPRKAQDYNALAQSWVSYSGNVRTTPNVPTDPGTLDVNGISGNTTCDISKNDGCYQTGIRIKLMPITSVSISQNAVSLPSIVLNGLSFTMQYTVTNTGNQNLTGIKVTNSRGTTVTCPNTSLEASAKEICTSSEKATP